jgi:RNA polymerase sigma-70 factor (ECF subfamily)
VRHWVTRCLAGDQAAMLSLVEHYQARVFALCFRMLGQRQDAEDVAQETFVRALKSLHRWDAEREFEPWLLAIAGNRCRTALSSRKRRPAHQQLLEPYPDSTPEEEPARRLAEEVRLALAELRHEYRQAFVLFHEHQMSYAEIGESLGRPLGTIKTWVHRARKEMIDFLGRRGVTRQALGSNIGSGAARETEMESE